MVYHGIAAASVICLELFKDTRLPQPRISRSGTILTLSMFIGFLNWIRPTDGNYELCQRIRNVIGRILERVLDPTIEMPMGHMSFDLEFLSELGWDNMMDWSSEDWLGGDFLAE